MVIGQLGPVLGLLHRPIRVAFAGHRPDQLPDEARAGVRSAIDSALDAIAAAGMEVAGKHARFVLVSALAEGADRMAAEAALARSWRLEAPLPFSIERYEQDFAAPASVQDFQRLLKSAAKVSPQPKNDADPDAGYAGVGEAVARGAEVGVIVWNGQSAKGRGGTAHVAARLLEAGAPVIWIGLGVREKTKLVWAHDDRAKKTARAKYFRAALAHRIERVERPAAMQAVAG